MYSSEEDDVVLDPFLGSGQVAVVSKMLKRQYIGFEVVKKYYEFADERLTNNIYRVKSEVLAVNSEQSLLSLFDKKRIK